MWVTRCPEVYPELPTWTSGQTAQLSLPLAAVRAIRSNATSAWSHLPRVGGSLAGRPALPKRCRCRFLYQLPTASTGVLPDLGELNLKVLLVGANSEVGGGARDKLGSAHVTQPLRFRGFEALPKGANPVGATTPILLEFSP